MKRGILSRLFTPEQVAHHLKIIRAHLLFPDGARLMDRPVTYRGGPERIFRRAESAANFGREIGLMYTHAHLRYAEAMATLGEAEALWDALLKVNPIAVTEVLGQASLRQRNAYFSSSDAAFPTATRRAPNGRASRKAKSPSMAAGASILRGRVSMPMCWCGLPSAGDGISASASRRHCCRPGSREQDETA